jgi:hypothetical protein
MRGEGKISDAINRLFKISVHKFMSVPDDFEFNCSDFNYKAGDSQMSLF